MCWPALAVSVPAAACKLVGCSILLAPLLLLWLWLWMGLLLVWLGLGLGLWLVWLGLGGLQCNWL